MEHVKSLKKPRPKPKPVRISEWLGWAVYELEKADVPMARLDAVVLMEDISGQSRAWLFAHLETIFDPTLTLQYRHAVARRTKHEPLAYIRQKCEFFGRDFYVTKDVLVPRPESEAMIELLLRVDIPDRVSLTDVGTGSGALGITAALELTIDGCEISDLTLIDIDQKCLDIAERNAQSLGVAAQCVQANFLKDAKPTDVILANLPYVPDGHTINQAAMIEPPLAIFGGPDGLNHFRTLFTQLHAVRLDWQPRFVFTESLPFQHEGLARTADIAGYDLVKTEDFIQVFVPKKTI
jgi:release factor glutamine methyltransferase